MSSALERAGAGRFGHARVVVIALSLLLSLLAAELALRLVGERPGFVARGSDDLPGLWIAHPVRGYAYAPGFRGEVVRPDFRMTIATSVLGFRGPLAPRRQGDELNLLAAGDSLTFGWGVEANEAWPQRLEAHLRSGSSTTAAASVANAGVSGYGLPQIAETVDELSSAPFNLVVVGVYAGGLDRLENPFVLLNGSLVRRSARPHLRAYGDGYLSTDMNNPSARALDFWLDKHFYVGAIGWKSCHRIYRASAALGRPLSNGNRGPDSHDASKSRREIQAAAEILGALRGRLRQRGIPLVVVVIATQDRDGAFPADERATVKALRQILSAAAIPVFDALETLEKQPAAALRGEFRFDSDGHWNATAHDTVATGLADLLRREVLPTIHPKLPEAHEMKLDR